MLQRVPINVGHIFCGLGGGAKGFNKGKARLGKMVADFRCLGGIDVDAASCRDFERLAGAKATCLDLFERWQYEAFHGSPPPRGWRPAMPADIVRAFGGERPHILFLSAPCKGFSGLLSEAASGSDKYQALNGLALRGIWLALEAYKDDPIELILFENVPRIANRGRHLLDQITALLRAYGYAIAETKHDCGELGGLGQSRKRFLLVARHKDKVPNFLYEPIKRRLRGVGEIIGDLPVPSDVALLPMHRVPSLQWQTWVRLAFVEAGADWRSLRKLNVKDGVLTDFAIVPGAPLRNDALGISAWDEHTGAVIGESWPSNGRFGVADPRPGMDYHGGVGGVRGWGEHTGVVTGRASPTTGAHSVADPRTENEFGGMRMADWRRHANAITAQRSPGSSAQSVADPRVDGHERSVQMGVRSWDKTSGVVTGQMAAGQGPNSVADPRLETVRFNNAYRIVAWGDSSPAVAGPGGAVASVADPRTGWPEEAHRTKLRVRPWDEAAGTVTGSSQVGSGAPCVADPRPGYGDGTHQNVLRVTEWDKPRGTVTASRHPAGGAGSVADPRPVGGRQGKGKYRVTGFREAAGAVIGASTTGQGAYALADPRPGEMRKPGRRRNYETSGTYGVVPWDDSAGAVPGHGSHDNGRWSVADPRDGDVPADHSELISALPAAKDRLFCVIRALDGTWHRPFTTLELAALQGLVDVDQMLELDGMSDSAWRERIGNAVPPPAAEAIAGVMGLTLLAAWSGRTISGSTPVWVQPVVAGLMAAT